MRVMLDTNILISRIYQEIRLIISERRVMEERKAIAEKFG